MSVLPMPNPVWEVDRAIIELESSAGEYVESLAVLERVAVGVLAEHGVAPETVSIQSQVTDFADLPERGRLAVNMLIYLRYIRQRERIAAEREELEAFYHIIMIAMSAGLEGGFLSPEWVSFKTKNERQREGSAKGGKKKNEPFRDREERAKVIFDRLWDEGSRCEWGLKEWVGEIRKAASDQALKEALDRWSDDRFQRKVSEWQAKRSAGDR